MTDSYHRFNSTVQSFAERLQKEIEDKTGIYCTIGIGSNMLLSKVAMDIEAKHTSNGITEWRYHDVPQKCENYAITWFWGINKKTEAKLNKKGIVTVGDLAQYPYRFLKRDFGVLGIDMHLHANGIDQSKLREKYNVTNPSICKSQILMRDYRFDVIENCNARIDRRRC